jgi:cytochrome c oxidase cbb3-type subunit 4
MRLRTSGNPMSYDTIATFAKSWGLVYLCVLFLGVLVYALWPSNKAKFDKAARMPLEGDDR